MEEGGWYLGGPVVGGSFLLADGAFLFRAGLFLTGDWALVSGGEVDAAFLLGVGFLYASVKPHMPTAPICLRELPYAYYGVSTPPICLRELPIHMGCPHLPYAYGN